MSIRAIDVAYNTLGSKKEGMPFKELWSIVRSQLGYGDAMAARKISQFYTNLTLDGRFVELENNVWNLKSHCRYDEVAVKAEDYQDETDDEEADADTEDEEEESTASDEEGFEGNSNEF